MNTFMMQYVVMKITTDIMNVWVNGKDMLFRCPLEARNYKFYMDDLDYSFHDVAYLIGSNPYYIKGLVIGARAMMGVKQKLPFVLHIEYQTLAIGDQEFQFGGPRPNRAFYRALADQGIKSELARGIIDGAVNMRGPALRSLNYRIKRAKVKS